MFNSTNGDWLLIDMSDCEIIHSEAIVEDFLYLRIIGYLMVCHYMNLSKKPAVASYTKHNRNSG